MELGLQPNQKDPLDQVLDKESTFESFGLDDRLLKSLSKHKLVHPTLIQSSAIPLALKGKDIVARARTGSGKTAAYSIPIIQSLIRIKTENGLEGIKALVLVPTRELCEQVKDHFQMLTQYLPFISAVSLGGESPLSEQASMLKQRPTVLVATPARLLAHLEARNLAVNSSLQMLVVDEADRILSFGYEEDVQKIVTYLPKICQSFLMSATLSPQVETLKKLILHNPAVLKLEETPTDVSQLIEYAIRCSADDKFLIIYALVRLKIIPGKAIFFVNNIDRSYKLKLFLERFSIKSAVLNSELPHNSRYHILQEFNKGIFDYLIATDETFQEEEDSDSDDDDEVKQEPDEQAEEANAGEGEEEVDEEAMDEEGLDEGGLDEEGIDEEGLDEEGMDEEGLDDDDDEEEEGEGSDEDEEESSKVKSAKRKQTERESNGKKKVTIQVDVKKEKGKKDKAETQKEEAQEGKKDAKKGKEAKESKKESREEKKNLKKEAQKIKRESRAKGKNNKRDREYGVARGVDFKGVQTVINFDFPTKVKSYIHRVGRTARGGARGTALSLVTPNDNAIMKRVETKRSESGNIIQPYKFNISIIEGLRYRVEDILRGVTKAGIREARLKEIKAEILNSEKLKNHFESNPADLNLLKHDKMLQEAKIQPHLKFIPRYLVPTAVQDALMPKRAPVQNVHAKKHHAKSNDPLKTFSFGGKRSMTQAEVDDILDDSLLRKQKKGKRYGPRKHFKKRKF